MAKNPNDGEESNATDRHVDQQVRGRRIDGALSRIATSAEMMLK